MRDENCGNDGAGYAWTRHPPRRRRACQSRVKSRRRIVYDAPMPRGVALLVMALAVGCASGGGGKTELAACRRRSRRGRSQTAGPRCRARPAPAAGRRLRPARRATLANEGDVAAGKKRFEFRTGRGFEPMSVTIDGKARSTRTHAGGAECGYVDSPTRPSRGQACASWPRTSSQGIHPRLLVGELGKAQRPTGTRHSPSSAAAATGPASRRT